MINLVDFRYQKNFAFWEYYFYNKPNVWSPTPTTTIKRITVESGDHSLAEHCIYPNDPCIVVFMTPVKNLQWTVGGNKYRMMCYTKVKFDIPKVVRYSTLWDQPGYFFIIQGDLNSIEFEKQNRAAYKTYRPESWIQQRINKPVPAYVKQHDTNWSITDADSETTVISHVDAGWWFNYDSLTPWYAPYQLSWRKLGVNSLTWRTPGDALFKFSFDRPVKETVEQQIKLIKQYLPKTKRVVYFGQCLGTNYALMCAYSNEMTTSVYLTTPCFNISEHKANNLLELTPDINIDDLDSITWLNDNTPNPVPGIMTFKIQDHEEQRQLMNWKRRVEPKYHQTTQTHSIHFEDVFAPVFGDREYAIKTLLGSQNSVDLNDHVHEEHIDNNTVINKDKGEFKHL